MLHAAVSLRLARVSEPALQGGRGGKSLRRCLELPLSLRLAAARRSASRLSRWLPGSGDWDHLPLPLVPERVSLNSESSCNLQWYRADLSTQRPHSPMYLTDELVHATSAFIHTDSSGSSASSTDASGRNLNHLMLLGGTKSGKTAFANELLPGLLSAAYASPQWAAAGRPRPVAINLTLAPLRAVDSASGLESNLLYQARHGCNDSAFNEPEEALDSSSDALPLAGRDRSRRGHAHQQHQPSQYRDDDPRADPSTARGEAAMRRLPQTFLRVARRVRQYGGEPWFIIDSLDEPLLSAASEPEDAKRLAAQLTRVRLSLLPLAFACQTVQCWCHLLDCSVRPKCFICSLTLGARSRPPAAMYCTVPCM